MFYVFAGHCRTVAIIVVNFVILCAVSIVVIIINCRSIAIIVNNSKTPAHRRWQRHYHDKGKNKIATTAKMHAHWQQQHHHKEGHDSSSTMAICLYIDDAHKPCKPLLWASARQISPSPHLPLCFVTFVFRIFFILSVFSSSHPPILVTSIIFHRVTTLFSWRCQKPSISWLPQP